LHQSPEQAVNRTDKAINIALEVFFKVVVLPFFVFMRYLPDKSYQKCLASSMLFMIED
jgi:hypothetical protein